MEILLLILAFLFGLVVGAVLLWFALQYLQKRMLKKAFSQITMPVGTTDGPDPFTLVMDMANQMMQGAKKKDG